ATARNAASSTASGSPANVSTLRLWSGSISRSRNVTPGTAAIASSNWSTTSRRRPSEKFGTHSTRRGILGILHGTAAEPGPRARHANPRVLPPANPARAPRGARDARDRVLRMDGRAHVELRARRRVDHVPLRPPPGERHGRGLQPRRARRRLFVAAV